MVARRRRVLRALSVDVCPVHTHRVYVPCARTVRVLCAHTVRILHARPVRALYARPVRVLYADWGGWWWWTLVGTELRRVPIFGRTGVVVVVVVGGGWLGLQKE